MSDHGRTLILALQSLRVSLDSYYAPQHQFSICLWHRRVLGKQLRHILAYQKLHTLMQEQREFRRPIKRPASKPVNTIMMTAMQCLTQHKFQHNIQRHNTTCNTPIFAEKKNYANILRVR